MDGVWLVIGRFIRFIFDEVVGCDHFYVGVIDVDSNGSSKRYSHGPISSEKCPPDAFPEALVGEAQLGVLDTVNVSFTTTPKSI